MSYQIQLNEPINDAVIRVAREQIGKAIDELEDRDLDRHDTVHQVRKRCKKVRGLLRLVRPAMGDQYEQENACFRDAARTLSYVRDAQSQIECFDDLVAHFNDELAPGIAHPIREQLLIRRRRVADDVVGLNRHLDVFAATMHDAYLRCGAWKLEEEGFDALAGGLLKTYKRARKAMPAAYENPTAENFHEWRKRMKYHWYHLRLLKPLWKEVIKKEAQQADDLGDLLGDEHDLAVLRATLLSESEDLGEPRQIEVLVGLVDRRRADLQAEARPLGERLLAEKPKALKKRLKTYWEAGEL